MDVTGSRGWAGCGPQCGGWLNACHHTTESAPLSTPNGGRGSGRGFGVGLVRGGDPAPPRTPDRATPRARTPDPAPRAHRTPATPPTGPGPRPPHPPAPEPG